MRRTDDVFFFTLIDFLVQVFFFGLMLFVVNKAMQDQKDVQDKLEKQKISDLKKASGFSSLTEISDFLTKLAPVKDFQGFADFYSSLGTPENAMQVSKLIKDAGGVDQLQEKVKKYDDAYGLPPCIRDEVDGRVVPRSLAVLRVEDQYIQVQRSTPDFDKLLSEIGFTLPDVERLTLVDFRDKFKQVKIKYPNCAYFVEVQVNTQYLKPMRAVWSNFRVK